MFARFQATMLLGCLLCSGCYALRPSNGAGQTKDSSARTPDPTDVLVPSGYRVQLAAANLTFPTGVAFDNEGRIHVVEAGYSYGEIWTIPRLVRIDPGGVIKEIARGRKNGPWTGVVFHEGNFYVAEGGALEGGRILRIDSSGHSTVIVSNLPSFGDHHSNGPLMGSDGWLYFAQGTASNSGVIGEDNAEFGWLQRQPAFHDFPGQDIELTGENFRSRNVLNDGKKRATTGAFLPFGEASHPGQIIRGRVPCNGSIMRVRPDGSALELFAWGLRNPFGLVFAPDGRLFVTENSYDDRGSRPIWGTPDILWEVRRGTWYGWPDFAAGLPITHFKPPGKARPSFLLTKHPNQPPKPTAKFAVHASACGLDISHSDQFGYTGEAFVAIFGDQAPTVGKMLNPVGAQVVRVNLRNGVIEDFVVNRGPKNAPASKLGHGGLERPVAARFTPDGRELYVVDFGIMRQDAKGAHPVVGTGALWRVARQGAQVVMRK